MRMNKAGERAKSLLFEPGDTLSQRVVRGGFWVFALRIADRLFQLIRTIVLARVLAPSDFGLMGIALLAISALETFSQTGYQAALIQKKENIEDYLDTAWTVSALRGFFLFSILYLAAPYIALFFVTPAATPIMRAIGVSMLLNGLTNIGVVYFRKELEFNKQFVYQLSGTVADLVVATTAALLLRSVWALVFGLMAGSFTRFVASYLIHPYRPRLNFDLGQSMELFDFGIWMLGSSIVVFLAIHGDDAFVGKALGVSALGFYQMAFRFANLPGSEIGVLSRVAFPAYSKLQDNIPKLKGAYLKMVRFVTFLAIPLAGGIFALGPQLTQIFLGDKWMPMVPALRILAISAMVRQTVGTGGALFYAVGRPDMDFKMNLARVITLAVTIYPLTMVWETSGTSLAVLLAICACIPIWIIGSTREIKIRARHYLRTLLLPLLGTVIMSMVIFILGIALDQSQLMGFLISVLVGIVIYFGFAFLGQSILDYPIFKDVRFILNSLRLEGKAR
jgi:lipopolysaccharide exporter